jgi:hypothetical protein
MKSSRDRGGLDWVRGLFQSFFGLPVKPTSVTDRIARAEPDLLAALVVVLLSGAVLTLGAFIAGGTALEVYQYQISSFLIELLTTPFPSPASITSLDYAVAFLKDIVFFVKMWLVFSVIEFVFIRIFRGKASLMDTLVLSAWTISPWALVGFLFGPISFLVKLGLPLLYQYAFLFPLVFLGLIVAPAVFIRILTASRKIPIYKVAVSYMLSLFALFVVFTLNHPDILFYIVG